MSDVVHVIRATIDPNTPPTREGQHWVNTTTNRTWLSVGTTLLSHWVLVGEDHKVASSATDTTPDYLGAKLAAGTGISLTTLNPGANEIIQISAPGSTTDEKVKVSASDTTPGYLNSEVTVSIGTNVTNALEKSITNPSGDEKLNIQFDQTKVNITSTQVSDFTEAAQDAVGTALTASSNITPTYNDSLNTISHDLTNTTVTSGSYGSATQVATFTVDSKGRLTSAGNTSIAVPSTAITDFTEAVQDVMGGALVDSASVDFVYNDLTNTQTANVLPAGVNHDALQNWVANKHIDHSTVSITAGTGLTGGGDITTSRTISIAATGVTASTYGSATQVSVFTVNAQGQLTAASSVSIAIPSSQITDFSESVDDRVAALLVAGSGITLTYNDPLNTLTITATNTGTVTSVATGTGLTGGPITSSGTISIANTTVTASSYGSATQVATFTVNAQGQLTAAANVSISIPSTQVSDFTEAAQDAVGGILTDTASIDFTYNDAGNQISAVVLPAGVDHDLLFNFVANEHINHSSVSIIAGTGLTGGGDLTASRTLSIANVGTAGTYGSATQVPVFTTNAQGQVTSVTNTTISTGITLATGQVGFGSGSNQIIGDNELFWDNTNKWLGIGTSTPQAHIHVVDDLGANIIFEQSNNSLGESAFFESRKSRGTTASKIAVVADDKLGGWGGLGWTGTQYLLSTYINFFAEAAFTNTSSPGYFSVFTTPVGSTTPLERLRIKGSGDSIFFQGLRIGTTTDTTNGNLRYDGTEFQVREGGSWRPISQIPISTSSSAAVNSTSASFATLSISTTPAAGSYKLDFTASGQVSAAVAVGEWAVFVGGVQQTVTNRRLASVSTTTIQSPVAISTIITVNGAQAVDIQFRRVSGTGTVTTTERQMLLTPYTR